MCKFCRGDLTGRKECGIRAIAIIILSVVIISYVSTRKYTLEYIHLKRVTIRAVLLHRCNL